MKIAVIGSGVAGLAAAIKLKNRGHNVTIFEKNSVAGGKISQIRDKGFRFDTGPSLFTLPELVDEIFIESGVDPRDYFKYEQLDSSCKYFFANGKRFSFASDRETLRKEISKCSKEPFENIEKRLDESKELYEATSKLFIFSPFYKAKYLLNPSNRRILPKIGLMRLGKSMHQANCIDFVDKNIIQLFDRYATYTGSNPFTSPATLNMIAHLEHNTGAYFPTKGIFSIAESLSKLAAQKGVIFAFNTLVDKIITSKGRVVGIEYNNTQENFDAVISDCDIRYFNNNILKLPSASKISTLEPSSSALIFYWGVNRSYDMLEMHNILFSGDYEAEFKLMFDRKIVSFDPTVYIFISSKRVKEDAPEGCENWFVMINAPVNRGQDWQTLVHQARAVVIKKINETLGVDIERHIVTERVATPPTIEKDTLSLEGALYGAASNSMRSAFFKHPNYSSKIKNLYFVGGSVHPGGGIPLCIAGASIVAGEFFNSLKKTENDRESN